MCYSYVYGFEVIEHVTDRLETCLLYFLLMIFFFSLLVKTIEYGSEDDLRLRCSLCKKIQKYHEENPNSGKIQPKNSSFCTENPSDKWCSFIDKVSEQYLNSSTRQKANFCYLSSICYNEPDSSLSGPRCGACVFLANHLMRFPPEHQNKAFSSFCITSKSYVASLCADIEDESLPSFLNDVNQIKDAEEVCQLQHFCRVKKDRKRKDDANEEL